MTASPNPLTRHAWRLALVASGLLLMAGGLLHPNAGPEGSLREDLATMTADDAWVPGHSLLLVSTVLLALGLGGAVRSQAWPLTVRRPLRLAALAASAYVVEAAFHLAAVVDTDALRDGDLAPVAFTHVALSLVLYPVAGAAIAALGLAMARTGSRARRVIGGIAVLGGTVHALSVPFTVLLPDTESTPLFAGAAALLALWSVLTGVVGAPRPAAAVHEELAAAA